MTPGARCQAAIDILHEFAASPLPLDRFLDAWARGHRYAGAKDRAAIRELVYGVMRRRAEYAHVMESEVPRALVLGELALGRGLAAADIEEVFDGRGYGPAPLEDNEKARLQRTASRAAAAPDSVRLNIPGWIASELVFPERSSRTRELAALSSRAPLDLRANTLKTGRDALLAALHEATEAVAATAISRLGLRVPGDVSVNFTALPAFKSGLFDIQDEAFQIATALVDARAGQDVLDLCAGGGGKTLALAAAMGNVGRLVACDTHAERLRALTPRLERAGVRNVDLRSLRAWCPTRADDRDPDLGERFDRVLVDAPCSGSGAWRRNPDAKWRLTPERLRHFVDLQSQILDRAARLVAPDGRLIYVTCSLLGRENRMQVESFLHRHPDYRVVSALAVARASNAVDGMALEASSADTDPFVLLSPGSSDTDGAFAAVLERRA